MGVVTDDMVPARGVGETPPPGVRLPRLRPVMAWGRALLAFLAAAATVVTPAPYNAWAVVALCVIFYALGMHDGRRDLALELLVDVRGNVRGALRSAAARPRDTES